MKKPAHRFGGYFLFLAVTAVICILGLPAFSNGLGPLEKDRVACIWIEGEMLGDMILGAKGQLTFVCMDSKACRWAAGNRGSIPEWLSWNLQHRTAAEKEKKALFLLRYKAIKNWNFDPKEIKIGGYSLKEEDLVTRNELRVTGDLPPDTKGTLALLVPPEYLKPGSTIALSYGPWAKDWTVPGR